MQSYHEALSNAPTRCKLIVITITNLIITRYHKRFSELKRITRYYKKTGTAQSQFLLKNN